MVDLEKPEKPEALYLATGSEVPVFRPYLTGDTFEGISLPGFDDELRSVMILTHPCSMREAGVRLMPRLLVAEVRRGNCGWRENYDKMPVPSPLVEGEDFIVDFANTSSVASDALETATRWLVLSNYGRNLLQQQFVHYLTRLVVESYHFQTVSEHVYEEVEVTEDWLEEAFAGGYDLSGAQGEFHEWIRGDVGGETRQDLLSDPQRRKEVVREARREARKRYGDG